MPRELKSLEERLEWLADEVLLLKEHVGVLSSRLAVYEQGGGFPEESRFQAEALGQRRHEVVGQDSVAAEETWVRVGQEVLLPRLAAISFMLVVALILRTVTDSGMIGSQAGSFIGMAYASALIGGGFYLYRRQSRLAPVFPTCGVLLLYAILFETITHFSSLPPLTVYLLLLVAEIAIIAIGLKCRAAVLLFLAVFGSTFIGYAFDFSNPKFVIWGLIILVNSIAAHIAERTGVTRKLRWYTLLIAVVFWMLWAYKLNFYLRFRPDALDGGMGLTFYLPLLTIFWAFYTFSSLWRSWTSGTRMGAFHNILPAITAGGTFFAAYAVLSPWVGHQHLIGFAAVFVSACYMGLVAWQARRSTDDVPGGKEFVTAATVLLVQGLAVSLPIWLAMPIWSVAAGVLTLSANNWRSGGIRVISYLFQVIIMIIVVQRGGFAPGSGPASSWLYGALSAGAVSACCLWLYAWCRRHRPQCDSAFFTLFDKRDSSAIVLLLLGAFYGFCAARLTVSVIVSSYLPEPASALLCSQSVIINLAIVLLMVFGLKQRRQELLVVAALLIVVSALKVFLVDLLRGNGLSLVLSVFSFGVVAAVSSVVMRKWRLAGDGGRLGFGD